MQDIRMIRHDGCMPDSLAVDECYEGGFRDGLGGSVDVDDETSPG